MKSNTLKQDNYLWKHYIFKSGFIFMCFIGCILGCYSNRIITRQELEQRPQDKIVTVCTTDTTYNFGEMHMGKIVDDTLIVGRLENGSFRRIPIRRVSYVVVQKLNTLRVIMASAACITTIFSVLLINALLQMDQ